MPDLFEEYFKQFDRKREDYIDITLLDPSYRIYFEHDDQPYDLHKGIESNRELFESLEPWSTDLLHTYLKKSKYQYDIAMQEMVPKNYDSIRQFFTRKMATTWSKMHVFESMKKYVQRWFKTPKVQKILQYPLVFLGTQPKDAPALYNIMSYVDFWNGVYYPKGWVYGVVEGLLALAQELGVKRETNAEVSKIEVENAYATSMIVNWTPVSFDYVISNADYHWTETQLLDPKRQTFDEQYRSKRTMAPSGYILYLGIDKKLPNLKHHTLYFSEDRDQNFGDIFERKIVPDNPSLYICCPSQTDPHVAPEWKENIFVLVPFTPWIELTQEEDDRYRDHVIELIEGLIWEKFKAQIIEEHRFSVREFKSRYNAYKWTALGIAHTLRQTAIFRPNTKSEKVKNLFYTGQYTNPWIGMPMCLISWGLAYERVATAEST